jgi:hypothetical protein
VAILLCQGLSIAIVVSGAIGVAGLGECINLASFHRLFILILDNVDTSALAEDIHGAVIKWGFLP